MQDIALIRAAGHEIISTNRGYLLNTPHSVNRIFKVNHTDEELEDELCTVVDLGGKGGERDGQSQGVRSHGGRD